jgi:hypothetical protein
MPCVAPAESGTASSRWIAWFWGLALAVVLLLLGYYVLLVIFGSR